MKHQLILSFRNKEEAMEFLGQLSDGFGEEYCDVRPTDRDIVHWDDTTEFDVELHEYSEASVPPVDPHQLTEALERVIKSLDTVRKEVFGDWEEGDDE